MKGYQANEEVLAALKSIEATIMRDPSEARLEIKYLIERLDTGKIDY